MKDFIKKIFPDNILDVLYKYAELIQARKLHKFDLKRFKTYSFHSDKDIKSLNQFEAKLFKEYHSIEKGLSYNDEEFRPLFGKNLIDNLVLLMESYKRLGYPESNQAFQNALASLNEYVRVHEEKGFIIEELKSSLKQFQFLPKGKGGIVQHNKDEVREIIREDFYDFSNSRHSVREFSKEPVSIEKIEEALNLAQNTPSACNRQSWRVRIVTKKELKEIIQNNQNGNRGFGHNIDKFIVITADIESYSKVRERKQAEIDGGMYAMNLLYSLHYYNIAAVPLSGSLILSQELNLRKGLQIPLHENFIMFIGVGNYCETYKSPISKRNDINYILM